MASPGVKPGTPKPPNSGRKLGTPNKTTLDLIQTLNEQGYSPVAELIWTAKQARIEYERVDKIHQAIVDKRAKIGMVPLANNEAATYLKIVESCAADMLPYMFPRRKAIEFDGAAGSVLQTFAEIMKEAVGK